MDKAWESRFVLSVGKSGGLLKARRMDVGSLNWNIVQIKQVGSYCVLWLTRKQRSIVYYSRRRKTFWEIGPYWLKSSTLLEY